MHGVVGWLPIHEGRFTTFRRWTCVGQVSPVRRGAASASGNSRAPTPDPVPFGSSVQPLALVQVPERSGVMASLLNE